MIQRKGSVCISGTSRNDELDLSKVKALKINK